jgi:predicted ribosomally synthesized peptide with nif11-like leader
MTQAREFVDRIRHDHALAEQVRTFATDERALDRLVLLGAEHGYSFDAEQLAATLRPGVAGHELSENELERVHGGIIAILIGLVESGSPTGTEPRQDFPKVEF